MSEKTTVKTATVHPSSTHGVYIKGEGTYVLIDQSRLDVAIGNLMELFDILPKDQGDAIKKMTKKSLREWLDGYYNDQALKSDGTPFYGYYFDGEDPNNSYAHISGRDEIYVMEPKTVPAFDSKEEAYVRTIELQEKHKFFEHNTKRRYSDHVPTDR